MIQFALRRPAILLLALVSLRSTARAQCHEWSDDFAAIGFDTSVRALVEFDDGSGRALYAAGSFRSVNSAQTFGVARWNGTAWTQVGAGLEEFIEDLVVFDDGSGPTLYAAGRVRIGASVSPRIMRWNGLSWTQLGGLPDDKIEALAVFDAGSGPRLYVSGEFISIGSVSASGIARWSGTAWQAVGSGANGGILDMEVVGQGAAARLYVAGGFTGIGGISAPHVAVWNGTSWSAPWGAAGPDTSVHCITTHDFGSGPEVVIGGSFDTVAGIAARAIARWNGSSWAAVGTGLAFDPSAIVESLHAFDDGAGTKLYATGIFSALEGAPARNMARWEGASWSTLGAGNDAGVDAQGNCLATFDEGNGDELYVGGEFHLAGNVVTGCLARWNGLAWSAIGTANGQGLDAWVRGVTLHDDGSGSAVWVGGYMKSAGSTLVNYVTRWNGSSWSQIGGGTNDYVECFATLGSGAGSELYIGGFFTQAGGVPANHVARWDGNAWSAMGNGVSGLCSALESFDSGSGPAPCAAYLAGANISRVARWDGNSWTDLPGTFQGTVYDMIGYDDGSGPRLLIAGTGGGLRMHNGTDWVSFAPMDGTPLYLAVMYGDLIICGTFQQVGGVSANNLARFDGTSWSALGSGLPGIVNSLGLFDDGSSGGLSLYAGGQFSFGGAVGIARWDGVAWHALDAGPSQGAVFEMTSFDDGSADAPALFVGGFINHFGGQPTQNFGRYGGCGQSGKPVCFGDGSGSACPCGNTSLPLDKAGCLNSTGQGGALRASGSARITHDTLTLRASGLPPTTTALFFQGNTLTNGGNGVVFGDGLRCAQGSVVRVGTRAASGGVVVLGDDVPSDPALHVAGHVSTAARREYQVWYRNAAAFCTPSAFNLTNAVEIDWTH